jgi:ParB-like chromosome segregation protein Spo0J
MKQLIKISKVSNNPNNPRTIKNEAFDKLVQSVKTFPEMLEKRPIIVDEGMVVLGGNMRLRACVEAGLKEVWVDVAEGWTEAQKKEFIIKDNVSGGDWDWDELSTSYDHLELEDWGVTLPNWGDETEKSPTEKDSEAGRSTHTCPSCGVEFDD